MPAVSTIIKLDKIKIVPQFAENAIEGLEYLKSLRGEEEFPSIIFTDINMPLKDGFEFVQDFVNNFPTHHDNIEIYILSTSLRRTDKERINEFGVINAYLEKPLRTPILNNILNQHIEKRASGKNQ